MDTEASKIGMLCWMDSSLVYNCNYIYGDMLELNSREFKLSNVWLFRVKVTVVGKLVDAVLTGVERLGSSSTAIKCG